MLYDSASWYTPVGVWCLTPALKKHSVIVAMQVFGFGERLKDVEIERVLLFFNPKALGRGSVKAFESVYYDNN